MLKVLFRIALAVAVLVVLAAGIALGVLQWRSPGKTADFVGMDGKPHPGSLASLERVRLGGVDQWVLIRGLDAKAPVALVFHGGPGSPEMAAFRAFNQALESNLVLVNWDQRGAGKSFDAKLGSNDLRIERFVDDGVELAEMLSKRFSRKLILVGHSWGSYLGVRVVQKRPDLFSAYVGIGQVNDFIQSERESWEFTLEEARKRNDPKAVQELEALGPPPWGNDHDLRKVGTQRNYLVKYGGALWGKSDYGLMISSLAACREYTLADKANYLRGSYVSLKAMWWQLNALGKSLSETAPEFKVPVFFLIGRHDRNVSARGSAAYFEKIKAPRKELVWFEQSAHMPPFEEPQKFNETLLRLARGL